MGGYLVMKKSCCKENIKGFTLIELLVVVLIIGILAAIALPQYQKAVERARTADALTRINAMEKAIELAVLQNGGIPEGYLLGNTGTNNLASSIQTDIELANGLACGNAGGFCYNEDWFYGVVCNGYNCQWSAVRGTDPAGFSGNMAQSGGDFNGQDWSRYCFYEGDKGEQICNMLASSLKIDDIEEGF